jgi:hypothetical protein
MEDQAYFVKEGNNYHELGEVRNNMIHYDFGKVLKYLDLKGRMLFGKHFKIHPEDRDLLLMLGRYIVSDIEGCEKMGLDLKKGLLLSGPVGCGKTSLMKLIRHITPQRKTYKMMPCRNIVFAFNNTGFGVIENYQQTDQYCFDDLGVEPKGRHFGQDCNVMGEVILCRYEVFSNSRDNPPHKIAKTHITTNLTAEELEARYGNRVRSRMREMFNLVSFGADSKDKRV